MFVFSKIAWWIVDPVNLLLLAVVAASLLSYIRGFRRIARRLLALTAVCALAIALLPIGTWMVRPLENRFPQVRTLPEDVAGVIVLGGAINLLTTDGRDQVSLSDGAERMTAFVALARERPDLRLVFSGGSGLLRHQDLKEAAVARRFFSEMGLDASRIAYESRSRNTYENARLTAAMLGSDGMRGRWVLVTSASHMPRAVGVFRKAGFTVLPYPVDYQTSDGPAGYGAGLSSGLSLLRRGAYEWLGLIAYRVLGRSDSLLPSR